MVLRTLTALTGGLAAGLVLGAKIPIVVPARADSMEVRMASCVLASLMVSAVAERTAIAPRTVATTPAAEVARAVA